MENEVTPQEETQESIDVSKLTRRLDHMVPDFAPEN